MAEPTIRELQGEIARLKSQIKAEAGKATSAEDLTTVIAEAEAAGNWEQSISLKMAKLRAEAPDNPEASSEFMRRAIGGLRPDGSENPAGSDGSGEGAK